MSIGLFEVEDRVELHICAIDKLPLPLISILAKFQWNNEVFSGITRKSQTYILFCKHIPLSVDGVFQNRVNQKLAEG